MGRRIDPGGLLFRTLVVLIYVFLLAAPLVVVYYSFSPGVVLRLPPEGVTLRWYGNFFAQPRLVEGIATSVWIAALATALALLVGVPAAYALTRSSLPGRGFLAASSCRR
jgi:putative spermidine/putrescine transport system permease protein